ncbi:MAG TPA: family 78 glycoside hydrolase catalytic domain [Flavihumibacter sp.]|nr:family 78 glycoside hydrolase catalytic domain [Flavihumibacter sp.]
MRTKLLLLALVVVSLFITPVQAAPAPLSVLNIRCEYQRDPVGITEAQPYFGWEIVCKQSNCLQRAYEIVVAEDARFARKTWSTGRLSSSSSQQVAYAGAALQSGKKYFWRVRVWDNHGNGSAWSDTGSWQMGLLNQSDWKAQWIEAGFEETANRPSPYFRKGFTLAKKVSQATLFITSHGLYEAFINGKRVGEDYLTPGWTSYNKRLQYQSYDVSNALQTGANAIGVGLGSGWYRGILAWENNKDLYGKTLGLLAQLQVVYTDGSTETIATDESWKSSTGAVLYSEIYHGETYDAGKEKTGWTTAAYNDADWKGVVLKTYPLNNLISTVNERVRAHEILKPQRIFRTPANELVVDFGQNTTGFVELSVQGNAGDTVRLQHAEVLDKAGNFYIANLRSAKQLNTYILSGKGVETFRPHFTFQGFRYVKLEGIKAELKADQLKAVVLYSSMDSTGSFSSSSALLNQLQHNIKWGQMGNFLDVPTDCPQRDERLGWTGDAQVFARTAAYNRQVFNFFRKWLKDVAADQLGNGSVPFVIPNVLGDGASGSTGWADAATIIPFTMWQCYGDLRILTEQYASMKAWVGYMEANTQNGLWAKGFHFGDWLFYHPDDDTDGTSAITDKYLIAQCFYAGSVDIMRKTAALLGKKDEEQHYTQLLQTLKDAFVKEYMTPNGRLVSGSQTAYVLALYFDMLPESLRASAAQRLADNIKSYNYHLTTGFLGTPYLCFVLSRYGYNDLAYTLLVQETYPSWLYPVKMGATTIWERWDGMKPDSSFQNVGMNSFNHYAYGAIGDWMYRVLAGIDINGDSVGYKNMLIRPLVNARKLNLPDKDTSSVKGALTRVSAALKTLYGEVRSGWERDGASLVMTVAIPANTKATITIPGARQQDVVVNGKKLTDLFEAAAIQQKERGVDVLAGSGEYRFVVSGYSW